MSCILVGATALLLSGQGFTLEWTHSVERVEWRETWAIEGEVLHLRQAQVKGSGAGMEAGDGAVLRGNWWVWQPRVAPLNVLVLAASGATGGGWRLCDADGGCHILGSAPAEPLTLRPCPAD